MKRHFSAGWFVVLLAAALWPATIRADLKVAADNTTVTLGDTVAVHASGVPEGAEVEWTSTWELRLLSATGATAQFAATVQGAGIVSAAAGGQWATTHITVTSPVGALGPVIPGAGRQGLGGDFAVGDLKKMQELLERYRDELGKAGLHDRFAPQAADVEAQGVKLPTDQAAQLGTITDNFFRELGHAGFALRDLQRYKNAFQGAANGGTPLFPGGNDWGRSFQGTERALMLGRAALVQQLWKETLIETLRENPRAGVFGEIDIGSWVKLQLGGLGFAADIDLSSVALDSESALNRTVRDRFEGKLRAHTSLDMIQADALLTAHGQATPDVFIGEWGKTFAELDMLKRSKWKLLRPKIVDGVVVDIISVERPGSQLFWEVAFQNGREVEFPKMDLEKEPMLSLEMLRHGIHDIEHGPYSRGQQLIKMLKYAERSYFMNQKAVAEYQWNPYTENDPVFAQAASEVIKHKDDQAAVDRLLTELNGGEITEDNVDVVTEKLIARAKIAMHDNAAHALAFRLKGIAGIDNEDTRRQAAEKMWQDLDTELKVFEHGVEKPQLMVDALELTKAVAEGRVSPEELEQKSAALEKLLNETFKLSTEVVQRTWVGDSYAKLRAYLGKKMRWTNQQIEAFITAARQKFPNGAKVHDAVMRFNEHMARTVPGQGLLDAASFADGAFSVYDAYLSSADENEALWNASIAMGRLGAQTQFPSLGIPLALYDSVRDRSPKPLGMAVAFMYFPWIGQGYMISAQLQRLDSTMRDGEFYGALGKMMDVTDFDSDGRIIRFRLLNKLTKLNGGDATEIDSADVKPPGDRKRIVAIFSEQDSPFYTSPNFRYFSVLVPKQNDLFGLYETKLQSLRRFFPYSEDVSYMTLMLENFRAPKAKKLEDGQSAQRTAILDKMESDLQTAVWVAMADALESAVKGTKRPELDEKIKKLEDELGVGDDGLGAGKGLRSMIQWEIRQNSSWISGENPYAVGLIYEKYQKAYDRVLAIRAAIASELWSLQFGADVVAAQQKPLKVFFQGSDYGAPRLSGNPEKDVTRAEAALVAHRKRAAQVLDDLAKALGRSVDPVKDKEHIKGLGQLALQWEHLIDEIPDRAPASAGTAMLDAVIARGQAYNDYLKNIGDLGVLTLAIEGPDTAVQSEPVTFKAVLKGATDERAKKLQLYWRLGAQEDGTLGVGPVAGFRPDRTGNQTLFVTAYEKLADGTEKVVTIAHHALTVTPAALAKVTIKGPAAIKAGETGHYYAEIEGNDVPWNSLRYEWAGAVGSDGNANLTAEKPGPTEFKVTVYAKFGGKEVKYGEASFRANLLGRTTINVPTAANADDILTASVAMAPEIASQVKRINWYGGTLISDGTAGERNESVRVQFGNRDIPTSGAGGQTVDRPVTLSVYLLDENSRQIDQASVEIALRRLGLSAAGADVWEGGPHPTGLHLKRKEATRMRHEGDKDVKSASATAVIDVNWMDSFVPKTMEDLKKQVEDARIWSALPSPTGAQNYKIVVEPFAIGDYRGYIQKTTGVARRYNGSDYVDLCFPQTGASGYALVMKGNRCLIVSYSASAGGMGFGEGKLWYDDMPFCQQQTEAALGEILGILGSLKFEPDPKMKFAPYAGPKLDGSDTPVPLSVKLSGPAKLVAGELGTVKATAAGGKPPYTYAWQGDHAGAGETVTIVARTAGEFKISVTSSDANGQTAGDTLTTQIEAVNPPIVGLPTDPVYGTRATPSVALPAGGQYRVVWQSTPTLAFDPVESTGKTSVSFNCCPTGGVKVWAEIHRQSNGAWITVGESPQVTVTIKPPVFAFKVADPAPKIGREVAVQIVTTPELPAELLDFRWTEPGTAQRREIADNASAVAVTPRDAKPLALVVQARVPGSGDDLGEIRGEIKPVAYKLKAWVVEPGNRPMIWKEGVGLVPVERGTYAGDELVGVAADFDGDKPDGDIRWAWTANDGTTVAAPTSRTPNASRHETGTASLSVTASDKENVILGTASVSFSVTVTAEAVRQALQPVVTLRADKPEPKTNEPLALTADVTRGTAPYRYTWTGAQGTATTASLTPTKPGKITVSITVTDAKGKTASASLEREVKLSDRDRARQEAERLAGVARDAARRGDFDAAVKAIEDARRADPSIPESVKTATREVVDAAKKAAQTADAKRDFATSAKLFGAAARLDPQDAEAARGVTNAPTNQKKLDELRAAQKELDATLAKRDLDAAAAQFEKLKNADAALPGSASAETNALATKVQQAVAEYTRDVAAQKQAIDGDKNAKRYVEARTKLDALKQQRPLRRDDAAWAKTSLAEFDRLIAAEAAKKPDKPEDKKPGSGATTGTSGTGSGSSTQPTGTSPVAEPLPVPRPPATGDQSIPGSVTGPIPTPTDVTAIQGSAAPLAGKWNVNFNGSTGTLTFAPDGSGTLNLGSGDEKLTNVRYNPTTFAVTFTRPLPQSGVGQQQVYAGRLTREGFAEGTFDCTVSGKGFHWWTQQTQKTSAAASSVAERLPVPPADGSGSASATATAVFRGELGTKWDKLQSVGGNFDRFARFEGRTLVVDVPAGNSWGKTGIMSHEPMLKVGAQPMSVIVRLDPARTTGVCVTFAASPHPDVYVLQNAWLSWIRTPAAVQADLWFGNTQNGNDGHVGEQIAPAVPAELVFTFQPGRASVLLPDGKTRSINLNWLKEGTSLFTHVFSHPTEANRPAKFALTSLEVVVGTPPVPATPSPAATTQGAGIAVGGLGDVWDKLSAAGGDFDRFARFDRGAFVVDVPAGNIWGKTGILSRERIFTLGPGPMHVTVKLDAARTTGFCVTFAASPHPDVWALQNVWFSWTRPGAAAQAAYAFLNTRNGNDGNVSELLAPTPPAELTFTLQPGRASVRLPDGKTRTINIGWLKPGTPVFAHVFSHPADSQLPAKFALTAFEVAAGAVPVPTAPSVRLDSATTIIPVGALGNVWDKLQSVGGNFDAFARFDRGTLVVDVPAGNSWGKTGIMSHERLFTLGKQPVSVAVKLDPSRTSGFCFTFAASQHPDVWALQNAWLSWTVPAGAKEADLNFVNTQNAGDGHTSEKLSLTPPAELVFTLQPGRIDVRLPDGKTRSIALSWMKEGTPIFGHFFTHPSAAYLPAKFALNGVTVSFGAPAATPVTAVPPRTPATVPTPATPPKSPATPPPAPTPPAAPAAKPQVIFNNWNTGGVGVGPTAPTTFRLDRPVRVTYFNSYHHNYGRGTNAGTLALRHSDGTTYGPWRVRGSTASGAPNGLWEIEPDVILKPGTYTVIDSDPATWSHNGQSGNRGFVEVRGVSTDASPQAQPPSPAAATPAKPTPAGTTTPNAVTFVTVTFENRAAQNVHVFVDGRETFGPENRLVPGAKRTLRVALPADGRLRFSAGRNGQVLARGTWNGDPADATRVPVVRFTEDGSPTLLVTTNLQ